MKLYKIKYAFIVAVGLMLHSCLDLEPKDQLAETNIWSTPSDFFNYLLISSMDGAVILA